MLRNVGVCCKLTTTVLVGVLSACLFGVSLYVNYQYEMTLEHVRFRAGFPSQTNWLDAPYGVLKCYLFNVTNPDAFLDGTDAKLKLQEIGPIAYRIKGRNKVIKQSDFSLTYEKVRYEKIEFDPDLSVSPDVLNQTIVLPNLILLGAAAKLHDWVSLVRHAFNAITINETPFITQTAYYFLWNFTLPKLDLLSSYVPNIEANCGILYNAIRPRHEVYNVNIGVKEQDHKFFRVNTLNNKTFFPEHFARLKYVKDNNTNIYCPIEVSDTYDNSIFTPFVNYENNLTIIAGESCRTFRLKFKNPIKHLGLTGLRYVIDDRKSTPNCLDNAMGIPLHSGIFDVSKCLFNDVPAAFSAPHFYGSSYDWQEHFENLAPSEINHDTSIVIEPVTGIPLEEVYRFQSNIPMPNMAGYNKDLQRFSNMILPTFWYEYDLDDLPPVILMMMKFQIFVVPIFQPILMGFYIFLCSICCLNLISITRCKKM